MDQLLTGEPADHHLDRPLRQLGAGRLRLRHVRLSHRLGRPDARQPVPRSLPPLVPRADRPDADPQDRRLRPDGRGAPKQSARSRSWPIRTPASAGSTSISSAGPPRPTRRSRLLAIEHQAPVVVGVARRIGPGFRYEIRCEEVIDPGELAGTADDVRLLTQRFTSALERLIRQDPTQYLWLHRRWKHQPQPRRATGAIKAAEG